MAQQDGGNHPSSGGQVPTKRRSSGRAAGGLMLRYPGPMSARKFELAFPGHALECLARTFDAILIVGSVRRKQSHDLIGAVGDHVANGARREVDGLTNLKLVFFQRGSPGLNRRHRRAPSPPDLGRNIAAKSVVASKNPGFCRTLSSFVGKDEILNILSTIHECLRLG